MIELFIIPILLCIFNIYRRMLCVIKVKFTKFTIITLSIVIATLFYIAYAFGGEYIKYLLALAWSLAFFTSLISSGISENGFIYPFYLIGKLYKWEKIRAVGIERNEKTFMLSFKSIRELRQEYDIEEISKVKQLMKEKLNVNLK